MTYDGWRRKYRGGVHILGDFDITVRLDYIHPLYYELHAYEGQLALCERLGVIACVQLNTT